MSCGNDCDPCQPALTSTESTASALSNLTTTLLGSFTKTIVNGRAVWSAVCAPFTDGLAAIPKNASEGFICYFLRVLDAIGLFSASIHSDAVTYGKNTLVASGASLYVSLLAVPVGIPISNTTYWRLLITAPQGVQGNQGDPGPAGSGSAVSYAVRTAASDVTLTNTDACLDCDPAAPMAVTVPIHSSLDAGKWFTVRTSGAFLVTVTMSGGNLINGAATYPLSLAGESITFYSENNGTWVLK